MHVSPRRLLAPKKTHASVPVRCQDIDSTDKQHHRIKQTQRLISYRLNLEPHTDGLLDT